MVTRFTVLKRPYGNLLSHQLSLEELSLRLIKRKNGANSKERSDMEDILTCSSSMHWTWGTSPCYCRPGGHRHLAWSVPGNAEGAEPTKRSCQGLVCSTKTSQSQHKLGHKWLWYRNIRGLFIRCVYAVYVNHPRGTIPRHDVTDGFYG